ATEALTSQDFGLADLSEAELDIVFELLKKVRLGAGDVAAD
ncbi:MAG: MarR family transcriptional regulator, partial [Modestobacter sp.]|nr:MarR family transcriptional regulator [Modestobacter sp.]